MYKRQVAAEIRGEPFTLPPQTTAFGALLSHITGGADARDYQPMNVNFGLFPPFEQRIKKKERKEAYTTRARADFAQWLKPLSAEGLQLA